MTEKTRRDIERKVSNFLNQSLTETEKPAFFLIWVEPQDDPVAANVC